MSIAYQPTKRFKRVLFSTLLPAPLGVFLFSNYILITDLFRGFDDNLFSQLLKSILLFTPIAYLLVGLQSILYAFIMEFLVQPYIKNSYLVVIVSILFGMFSGFPLILFGVDGWIIGILDGAAVGLIMGMIIRRMYCRSRVAEATY